MFLFLSPHFLSVIIFLYLSFLNIDSYHMKYFSLIDVFPSGVIFGIFRNISPPSINFRTSIENFILYFPFPKSMKVLVTGGAGFIGSHIAEYFAEAGNTVRIIDNLATGFIQNIVQYKNIEF